MVGNVELRLRSPFLPDLLQWTMFVDAGEVWNRGTPEVSEVKLKVTPGIQLPAFPPVGPVRIAVGYNPYQLPRGPIYSEATKYAGAPLLCVSPNNFLPTHFSPKDPVTGLQTVTQEIPRGFPTCAATYQPPVDNSLRSKLTFSFAIGQAF